MDSDTTQVDLLRHGAVQGGVCFRGSTDDPLTNTGWQQMRDATHPSHWDQVISSPLCRCADFAQAFAEQHALPLTFEPRFQEMHFGQWEGMSITELMKKNEAQLARFWSNPELYPPPEGECLSQVQGRVLAAWQNLIQTCNGQRVLLITHGGVIRILLCHLQQRPIAELLEIEVKHGGLYRMYE